MSNPSLRAASVLSADPSHAAASVVEHGENPYHAGPPFCAALAVPSAFQARAMVAITTTAATFTGLYLTTTMEVEWQVLLSIFAGIGIIAAWNMLYQSWRECTSASSEPDAPLATTQPLMSTMGLTTSKATLPHASNLAIVATSVITLASTQKSDLTPSSALLHKSPSWTAPTTHASTSGTAVNSRNLHTSAPGPLPGTTHFEPLLLPPVYSMSRTRSAGSPTASAAALAETAVPVAPPPVDTAPALSVRQRRGSAPTAAYAPGPVPEPSAAAPPRSRRRANTASDSIRAMARAAAITGSTTDTAPPAQRSDAPRTRTRSGSAPIVPRAALRGSTLTFSSTRTGSTTTGSAAIAPPSSADSLAPAPDPPPGSAASVAAAAVVPPLARAIAPALSFVSMNFGGSGAVVSSVAPPTTGTARGAAAIASSPVLSSDTRAPASIAALWASYAQPVPAGRNHGGGSGGARRASVSSDRYYPPPAPLARGGTTTTTNSDSSSSRFLAVPGRTARSLSGSTSNSLLGGIHDLFLVVPGTGSPMISREGSSNSVRLGQFSGIQISVCSMHREEDEEGEGEGEGGTAAAMARTARAQAAVRRAEEGVGRMRRSPSAGAEGRDGGSRARRHF